MFKRTKLASALLLVLALTTGVVAQEAAATSNGGVTDNSPPGDANEQVISGLNGADANASASAIANLIAVKSIGGPSAIVDDAQDASESVADGSNSSPAPNGASNIVPYGAQNNIPISNTGNTTTTATTTMSSAGNLSPKLTATRFLAGLFWSSKTGGMHRRCAATIISETVLLTSAACGQSANPQKKYGDGEWRVVAGTDDRFLETTSVAGNTVKSVDLDQCSNLATIVLSEPLLFGDTIMPIVLSNQAVTKDATLVTFNTLDATGEPFLELTQGGDDACEMMLSGYTKSNLLCTQPVQGQLVTQDYLGGDPIIGYSMQPSASLAVLVGVTGLYYSTLADARAGSINDPTAYRFSAMVAPHVNNIATLAGVDAQKISSTGVLS
ncbi:hypothetical protein GGI07_003553 [Coemansia sp. Benny D115]|nr:hypothetical protein GGI07_003553 [Coemansia sp. Benny D115]